MQVQIQSNNVHANLRITEPLLGRQTVSKISFANFLPVEKMFENNDEEIKIELIEEKDAEEVLDMLKEFFFKDEPMNTYLNLGECKELEEYSVKNLPDKCSFKAVDSNGKIVGVSMNGIINKPSSNEPFHSYADDCKHPKFKKILKLMEHIDQHFDIFDLYPNIDKFLDLKIVSVNTNYRGYGIAGKLVDRTIEHMREHNIPLIQVMCTSAFSARVCEKMKFKKVFTLPFVDYVVDGENPLVPAEPHKEVQIFAHEV